MHNSGADVYDWMVVNTSNTLPSSQWTSSHIKRLLWSPSVHDLFSDLEKTGEFPVEIQELLAWWQRNAWKIKNYITNKLWINIVSPNEKIVAFLSPEDKKKVFDAAVQKFWLDKHWIITNYKWNNEWPPVCGDGSDLFTIVKKDWNFYLVRLGGWEFDEDTFKSWSRLNKKVKLHQSQIPLFVVDQYDGYLKGDIQGYMMNIDPRLYLSLYSIIYSPGWWEVLRWNFFDDDEEIIPIDWSKVKVPDYDEAIEILQDKS